MDIYLPFGLRSAPSIFDNFATSLHWILEHNHGATLLHYLDDFLLLGPPSSPTCPDSMSTMLQVCQELGMPVAMEKSEGPATCLTFLGIELDSSLQQLRLPLTKPQYTTSLTISWLGKRSATKRELLSFIGKLSFAVKVVPVVRLFLRHLIHLSTTVRRLHHRIHLSTDARADIAWWDQFLPSWNGIGVFIAPEWKDADSVNLYTDAFGSQGFGAYFNGVWIRGIWQPHQQPPAHFIQWQELQCET